MTSQLYKLVQNLLNDWNDEESYAFADADSCLKNKILSQMADLVKNTEEVKEMLKKNNETIKQLTKENEKLHKIIEDDLSALMPQLVLPTIDPPPYQPAMIEISQDLSRLHLKKAT
jgi:hypothetical protein|tara:strand:+ start:2144 stop:2491 length:348 start_codon:yes stop_codon:yes gene_type:complete